MSEHPINKLHEVRREIWHGRPATRVAIAACALLAIGFTIFFLLSGALLPSAQPEDVGRDPIVMGADAAFDVIPAGPSAVPDVTAPTGAAPVTAAPPPPAP